MIGIDQSLVSERQKTFGKLIDGVLLCGSEHFKRPFWAASQHEMIISLKFLRLNVEPSTVNVTADTLPMPDRRSPPDRGCQQKAQQDRKCNRNNNVASKIE